MLRTVLNKSKKQHLKENNSCTATYPPSHKSSQQDEQNTLGTAEELRKNT